MSLDVYLLSNNSQDAMEGVEPTQLHWQNITHNLNHMASEAGIYQPIWRPEETGITTAGQLIELLTAGLALLHSDSDRFRQFNPENGWGSYEGLVDFVTAYLDTCYKYPDATVVVSR